MITAKGQINDLDVEMEYDEKSDIWLFNGICDLAMESKARMLMEKIPPVLGTYCPDEITNRYLVGMISEHLFDTHVEVETDFEIIIEADGEKGAIF